MNLARKQELEQKIEAAIQTIKVMLDSNIHPELIWYKSRQIVSWDAELSGDPNYAQFIRSDEEMLEDYKKVYETFIK